MLNHDMLSLIKHHSIGCIATVRQNGAGAVSPKATFLVVDKSTLPFANIRSPGTVDNLQRDPCVEVNFADPFHRMVLRVRGNAYYRLMSDMLPSITEPFRSAWPDLYPLMLGIVSITVSHTEMLVSPSYDIGADADAFAETWRRHFAEELRSTIKRKA